MDVVKTLKPGMNGTRRLVEIYGDDLIAVRYRLDPERQLSYTTVELIIEPKPAPVKRHQPHGPTPLSEPPNRCLAHTPTRNRPATAGAKSGGQMAA